MSRRKFWLRRAIQTSSIVRTQSRTSTCVACCAPNFARKVSRMRQLTMCGAVRSRSRRASFRFVVTASAAAGTCPQLCHGCNAEENVSAVLATTVDSIDP